MFVSRAWNVEDRLERLRRETESREMHPDRAVAGPPPPGDVHVLEAVLPGSLCMKTMGINRWTPVFFWGFLFTGTVGIPRRQAQQSRARVS